MIGKMRRAEALAAVALVVGAGQEPLAAFRRLAAEDPALSVLGTLAQHCAAGRALPDALVACRLLARGDATRLTGVSPATMADELTRLAQHTVHPSAGEVLARWLPLWVVLAATIPSLVLGAVVAVIGGALYGGVWQTLGMRTPTSGPALWWFVQCAQVCIAVVLVAGGWWLLRRTPILRRLTVFSTRLENAAAVANLVRSARAGRTDPHVFAAWSRRSGDAVAVRAALAACGGDVTATLIKLGVVPQDVSGRPEWEGAIAETTHHRLRAAHMLAPWLIAIVVIAGMYGFLTWEVEPVKPVFHAFEWVGSQPSQVEVMTTHVIAVLEIALGAVVCAHFLLLFAWLGRWVSGPAADLRMVADRMARALERRVDLDHILIGLRLTVEGPMRRRLDVALALTDETHPGSRLVKAGIIPRVQAQAFRKCGRRASSRVAVQHRSGSR